MLQLQIRLMRGMDISMSPLVKMKVSETTMQLPLTDIAHCHMKNQATKLSCISSLTASGKIIMKCVIGSFSHSTAGNKHNFAFKEKCSISTLCRIMLPKSWQYHSLAICFIDHADVCFRVVITA
jgi:hypothetical protein